MRFNVLEEYSLFLLNDERIFRIEDILVDSNEKKLKYKIKKIKDKRYSHIAKQLGYKNTIYKKDYINLINYILKIEEPILVNKEFVFPGVELDKIFINNNKKDALEIYTKQIISIIEKYKENDI